jgi:hypothetical protein
MMGGKGFSAEPKLAERAGFLLWHDEEWGRRFMMMGFSRQTFNKQVHDEDPQRSWELWNGIFPRCQLLTLSKHQTTMKGGHLRAVPSYQSYVYEGTTDEIRSLVGSAATTQ